MQILWFVIDVAIGLVVAGVVAPFALTATPEGVSGPALLVAVAVASIVVVSLLRHVFVGTPGAKARR